MMQESAQYTVLARRFRPQLFQDVVGQQHIAQALQNAIRGNRVAHAYLFTGARGVGKTSTARILAKALNCPHVQDAIPCNECEVCRGISAGNDVDVLEIDGASNRRIDDIRDIRANVSIKSMRSKYKVYIIDEVHMLTTEAFNALLKTLEEPPPNVKFVFCTTEPQKVPDTILSRCQRFDFSTIGTESISERLRQIAEAEGYTVDADALELVARRAAGSMRDSQSLFDQLLSFGETNLTAADVHKLLGTADDERLIALFDAVIDRRPAEVFEQLDGALAAGVQLVEFIDQCLTYCRDLMIVSAGADRVFLQAVFETQRPRLTGQAQRWGLETIVAALQILADTRTRLSRSVHARPVAELGLMRIAQLGDLTALSGFIRQLQRGQGQMAVVAGSGRPSGNVPAATPEKKNLPADSSVPVEVPVAAVEAPIETIDLVPENAERFLAGLVDLCDAKLKVHVKSCTSLAISGPSRLELCFPVSYDFSREYCERPGNVKELEETASKLAGKRVQVRLTRLADEPQPVGQTDVAAEKKKPEPGEWRPSDPSEITDSFVRAAVETFEATVVKVQPLREGG